MKHHDFMIRALEEARKAYSQDEVPVGAVVAVGGKIVSYGRNRMEELNDPAAHAELEAMKKALELREGKWLDNADLYSTLEPCPMCAAAAVLYRVKRIVFGASDTKWGACGTVYNIAQDGKLNHRIEVIGGIMEDECGKILRDFFDRKR